MTQCMRCLLIPLMFTDTLDWTGDMDSGVIREDLLSVLAVRLGDPELQNRGMQCNKAIRMVFPAVNMMRKGKFKTYPLQILEEKCSVVTCTLYCKRGLILFA